MSVGCYRRSDVKMISCIVEWTCEFVCRFVQEWMNKNGGWKDTDIPSHNTPEDLGLYDIVRVLSIFFNT
ncbi:hypothetical protein ACJMK2_023254 [Sinanodonta woodiana]|uniref:Uncharacterized protein n=1 Tax=Sinanodonta woodiana TaxID=1069815 RepID=A0ABD3T5A3_SINWO